MSLPASLTTVKARLTLWNVAVLALVLLVFGAVLRVGVVRSMTASVDRELTHRAARHQMFWSRLDFKGPPPWEQRGAAADRPATQRPPAAPGGRMGPPPPPGRNRSIWQDRAVDRFYSAKGQPLFPYGGQAAPWDAAGLAAAAQGRATFRSRTIDGEDLRLYTAPLFNRGTVLGVVQTAYSLSDVERARADLDRALLTLIPVALLAAGLGGLLLTGRMLTRVRDVTGAAARIGAEDLSRRLPVRGRDEFSELGATFNAMLARLERAFEQQRRFTADASHELRTPLTVIKAHASLALSRPDLPGEQRRTMESIDKAAGLMNSIVQDLLLLARADAGQFEIPLQPIALAEVLEVAVECVEPLTEAQVVNLIDDPDLMVLGDTGYLTRLFANLLENAVRHTPPGGRVTVGAAAAGETVTVTVEDTGSGIPPEHLPHVCERFYRVDAARSRAQGGAGLGLAICQSIAHSHGGRLDIESELGVGTTVRVTLQGAPRPEPDGAPVPEHAKAIPLPS